MKLQIRLDTMGDIQKFVNTVSEVKEKVVLIDDSDNCVSAKQRLGAIYTTEWSKIYCYCERDISGLLLPWIV